MRALIPLLALLVSCSEGAQDELARWELDEINKRLVEHVEKHELPALLDLITQDEAGRISVKGSPETPKDPWGTPYKVLWSNKPESLEVISYGPDKLPNTDDDISSKSLNRQKK